MSDATSDPELPCWHCGARNHPGSSECWLCQRRDWRKSPGLQPTRTARPRRGPFSTIGGQMVLIALTAVFLVVFLAAPPLAIALLICALPVWAITEQSARRRRRRAEPSRCPGWRKPCGSSV